MSASPTCTVTTGAQYILYAKSLFTAAFTAGGSQAITLVVNSVTSPNSLLSGTFFVQTYYSSSNDLVEDSTALNVTVTYLSG